MNGFSFVRAWTKGLGFFSGAAVKHAILLLGVGVVAPVAIYLLLLGQPTALMNPDADPAAAPAPSAVLVASAAGWLLQAASFFAAWRVGLQRGATLGGALGFGLLAGLIVVLGFFAMLFVIGLASTLAVPLLTLMSGLILIAFLTIFWTAFAAMFAVGVCLMFVIVLGIGAAGGDLTFAATVVGGGGWVWTVLVGASILILWLSARLSCTSILMAERRSFNLFAAMRDSWRLTWDDEWRIVRYLGLLGLAIALAAAAVIAAAGAGVAATLANGGQLAGGTLGAILLQVLAIPFAYLSVLVPAGIYRELAPADLAAVEVFA
jgi:hypothetical protein